jgi:PAS domain S-box-containing protein
MNIPLRLLLIDDNPDDRALVIRVLEKEFDIQVEEIIDEGGFAEAQEKDNFDVVITDYRLRWSSGLKILKKIKSLHPDCPVIMFTATGDEEIAVEAMRSNLDDYILKSPKHFTRLPSAVRTALKWAEETARRKKAEEALLKSEKKYRELVEEINDVIFSVDKRGVFTYMSPVIESLSGYRPSEIIGRNFTEFVSQEDSPRIEKQFQKVISGIIEPSEYRILTKSGELRWVRSSSRPILKEKQVIGLQGVLVDITERKRAEEEKERLQAQLIEAEKMAGIGTLTSGIAHEFNNLLQIMSGHTEYARRTKKPEEMEEALDIVESTSDKVAKIIKELLTFSRKETLEKELCDITEPIESVLSLTEEQLKKTNIDVIRKYEKTPRIEINKGEMQQVFLNIVTNARDAMLNKGGKLEIRISKANENLEISFTDQGRGIKEENLGKVFDPFYTTKGAFGGASRIQGIGLGLSVSYGIVQRHGGTIEVKSEVGKGTIITVKLPVNKAQTKRAKSKPEEKKTRKAKPLNILVVDDEEGICQMFTKWLSAEGHRVKTALNGKKALNLFKKERFDVVFLDVIIPGIPSISVLGEMKRIFQEVRVVTISGRLLDMELKKELKLKGASQHLLKPLKIEDINNCLASLGIK